MQLEDDVFGVVVNERERTDDENVWFSSGIKKKKNQKLKLLLQLDLDVK